jgi:plasmid stabilization system protein ParE
MAKKVKPVVWSELAMATLQIIYNYIAEESVSAAEEQMDRIFNRTGLLGKGFTNIGQRVELNRKLTKQYRYLVQDSYKIIYHEERAEIRIDLIFDSRQHPAKLKKLIKGKR